MYLGGYVQHLQSAEPHGVGLGDGFTRRFTLHQRNIGGNKCLVSTATATHNVHQSLVNHLTNLGSHRLSSLIVESHRIGQSGIGIGTHIVRCLACQLAQIDNHLTGTKRAVQTHREDGIAADAGQEGVEGLSTQRASCQITDCSTQHDGHLTATLLHGSQRGVDSHLCIQGVKDGLYQQGVNTTLQQGVGLFQIGVKQRVVGQITQCGIADIRRHRACLVGRSNGTSHKAGLF